MYFYLVIFLQHTCDLSSAMIGLDPGAKLSMWATLGRGREGGREEEEGRERGRGGGRVGGKERAGWGREEGTTV